MKKKTTTSINGVANNKLNSPKSSLTQDDEMVFHTQRLLYYNNLMIEQCGRWLTGRKELMIND